MQTSTSSDANVRSYVSRSNYRGRRLGRTIRPAILVMCVVIAGTLGSIGWNAGSAEAAPTWSVTASPDVASSDVLYGVSCLSSTPTCTAVGYSTTGSTVQTLVERWNGSSWSIIPSPNPDTILSSLLGVSCTSTTFCMAVGFSGCCGSHITLSELWNGSTWTVVPIPSPTGLDDILQSVSCTSSTNCIAVGEDSTNGGITSSDQPLAESWNGSKWSLTGPVPSGSGTSLYGVSCIAPSNCQAVGFLSTGTSSEKTLIVEWNGASWSLVSTPNPANPFSSLSGVSCASSDFCEAVGSSGQGPTYSTLIEVWNGSAWIIAPSPNTSTTGNYLAGVACRDVNDCVAVGAAGNGTYSYQTLVEDWDGASWSVVSSPNPSSTGDDFASVSCGDSTCQAVGNTSDEATTTTQTLIEIGTGYAPTTAVVLPSNGATLSGNQYLDASASSGVTQVQYELSGGPDRYTNKAISGSTLTNYGWIGGWNTTSVSNGSYILQSVASYAGGVTGTSAGIIITVNN